MKSLSFDTRQIAGIGLMSAVVVLLQILGSFIRFGPFSISLVLIPIVLGSALYGKFAGGWLGFVFGMTVLLSGDAAAFLAVSPVGTVITVLGKGIIAGIVTAFVFEALKPKGQTPAVIAAALVCPLVNTGVFLIGCFLFFYDTLAVWAKGMGFGDNVVGYMFLGLVGGNFLVEVLANVILCPAALRILKVVKRRGV